jgi:hypothetical protein
MVDILPFDICAIHEDSDDDFGSMVNIRKERFKPMVDIVDD